MHTVFQRAFITITTITMSTLREIGKMDMASERTMNFVLAAEEHPYAMSNAVMFVRESLLQGAGQRRFVYAEVDAQDRVLRAEVLEASQLSSFLDGRLAQDKEFARYVQAQDPQRCIAVYVSFGEGFIASVISLEALAGHPERVIREFASTPHQHDTTDWTRICNNPLCGDRDAATLKRCSRCRRVWYCSQTCQACMWPQHRMHCKQVN